VAVTAAGAARAARVAAWHLRTGGRAQLRRHLRRRRLAAGRGAGGPGGARVRFVATCPAGAAELPVLGALRSAVPRSALAPFDSRWDPASPPTLVVDLSGTVPGDPLPDDVLRSIASRVPVLTTAGSAAATRFGPQELARGSGTDEMLLLTRALLGSVELRDRLAHRARRRLLRDAPGAALPSVSVLVATRRPALAARVLRTVAQQAGVRAQVVVLAHGVDLDEVALRARARALGLDEPVLLRADADVPLGTCLDRLVAVADGEVVAKIDDDDRYGPHYLADQLDALRSSGADVVGKRAHHVHLRGPDATVLRFAGEEHGWADLVAGPTLVARRAVVAEVGFPPLPTGEDTAFLRRVAAAGGRVWASDRFGFVRVRSGAGHAWSVSDAELLAGGDLRWFGTPDRHVFV
jgi:hypothetical protein